MGKEKTKVGVPNKHMQARISFLQRAASYLTLQAGQNVHPSTNESHEVDAGHPQGPLPSATSHPDMAEPTGAAKDYGLKTDYTPTNKDSKLSRSDRCPPSSSARLLSHLALVAQKSQIRLDTSTKHQICKRCSTLLVEGSTCQKFTENHSRGGRKSHADVLVVECGVCRARKRWPVGMERQAKKEVRRRRVKADEKESVESAVNGSSTDVKKDGSGAGL